MKTKAVVTMTVNGEEGEVAFAPHKTLLEVLREDLGLMGTKHGCELGECGACAVLIELAAMLGPGQREVLAENLEEGRLRSAGQGSLLAVDAQDEVDVGHGGSPESGKARAFNGLEARRKIGRAHV